MKKILAILAALLPLASYGQGTKAGPGTTNTPSAWTNVVNATVLGTATPRNAASLTNLNASNLAGGTVPNARLPALISVDTVIGTAKVSAGEENVVLNENGNITFSGQIFGDGSQLTGISGPTNGITSAQATNIATAIFSRALTNNEAGIVTFKTNFNVAGSIISSLSEDNGAVFQLDPTITGTIGTNIGNVGGATFGMTYDPTVFSNGPVEGTNYVNDTVHFGMNVGTLSGGVANTNRPNLKLSWEARYWNGGTLGQEFHIQGVTATNAEPFRPFSVFVADDLSQVGTAFAVDSVVIADKAGNELMQVSDVDNAVNLIGLQLRFASNNMPAIQQLNAAGSGYRNLLYLDAGNVGLMQNPLHVVGPRAGAAAPYPGSFVVFQPETANTGDIGLLLATPAVTGTYNGIVLRAPVSTLLQQEFNNQGAGDSQVYVAVEGAGDPKLKFEVSGGGRFTMGIDNSDADKFKISTGSALGSGDAVTIDSSGNVLLNTNLTVFGQTRVGGVTTFSNQVFFGSENLGGGTSANLWFWSEDEVAFQHLRIEDSTFVFEGEVASTGFFGPGINITSLDASALTQGTVAPARLGSGSGGATKFLREDSTWQTVAGGGNSFPLTQDTVIATNNLAGVAKYITIDTNWNGSDLLGISWYYTSTKNSIYMDTNSLHFNTFGGQNMVFDQGLDVTDTVTANAFIGNGSGLTDLTFPDPLTITTLNVDTLNVNQWNATNLYVGTAWVTNAYILTNTAPLTPLTNVFVIGTRYTNANQRAWVAASFQLAAAVAGTASIDLVVEEGNGITNHTPISAGPLASLITIEPIGDIISPNARFTFVDASSGTGASVQVVTNSCKWKGL